MKPIRFAVLGDTHYCLMDGRSPVVPPGPLPDYFRYTGMTARVLPRLKKRIEEANVDFLFSTGDISEGMGGDERHEAEAAQAFFKPCAPEFLSARGSHDWKTPGRIDYGAKTVGNCRFLRLDYTDWGARQRSWLEQELVASASAQRIFVFGHAPLYLFGRHFFDSEPFRVETEELLKQYPVDVYFCGHTHNQTASFHDGMLQLAGSSLGVPEYPELPLEEFHVIPAALKSRYIWGIPEDYSPAYLLVEVSDAGLTVERHTLSGVSGRLAVRGRFTYPEVVELPHYVRQCVPLTAVDRQSARAGKLHVFVADKAGEAGSHLSLNGVSLGMIPHGICYEARRSCELPPAALKTLGTRNRLEIVFPDKPPFALGSFSLELTLSDGRTVRSRVAPERFIGGAHRDYTFAEADSLHVAPGGRKTIELSFPESEPDLI